MITESRGTGVGTASAPRAAPRRPATRSCSPAAARSRSRRPRSRRSARRQERSPCRPTSASPTGVDGAVRQDQGQPSAGSTFCSTMPASARRAMPLEDLTFEQWQTVVDDNLTGAVPLHAARLPHHEGPDAARRPHHQQRLDLGARAAADLRALHRDQARDHAASPKRPRSTAAPTTSPAARSTSATPRPSMTERMAEGVPQADGRCMAEPRMDVAACRPRHRLHGEPAARRERAVHDGDGDQDAVRRAGLTAQAVNSTVSKSAGRMTSSNSQSSE